MKKIKINLNKTIIDKKDPEKGSFLLFTDFLLNKYWDNKLPIDVFNFYDKLKININFIFDNKIISYVSNTIDNPKIFINQYWYDNELSLYKKNLELATQLGFILRKIDSYNINRNDDLFKKMQKLANHLLIPDDIIIYCIINKISLNNIIKMFKYQIPKDILSLQIDKINKKYFSHA